MLLVPYWPLLVGRVVWRRDVERFTFPAFSFLRDALTKHQLPFWNSHESIGFGVLGDPLYGLFYPPNWLLVVLPGPLPNLFSWFSFGHLLLGATGWMVLAARLGATGAASLVAGIAWGLSAYTTSEWVTGIRMLASAWIPWCALGFVHLAGELPRGTRASLRALALAALPVAMALLIGEFFLAIMAVGFGLFVGLAWKITSASSDDRTGFTRALVAAVGAAALGGAIAAVAILPAISFAASTARKSALPLDLAELWSLHPSRISELVLPTIFKSAWAAAPNRDVPWIGEVYGRTKLALAVDIYCGATVFALALAALRRSAGKIRQAAFGSPRLGLLLLAMGAVALATSLGHWTPVHRVVRLLVPPLAYMRFPEKYLVLVVASLALLAALGAARVFSTEPLPWRRLAATAVVIPVFGYCSSLVFPATIVPYVFDASIRSSLAVMALLGAALIYRKRPGLGRVLVFACLVLDLGLVAFKNQAFTPAEGFGARPVLAAAILEDARAHGITGTPSPRLFRGMQLEERSDRANYTEGLVANTSVPFGIDVLPGYDAAISLKFTTLALITGSAEVLRLLGVNYALLSARPKGPLSKPPPAALDYLSDPFPGATLYRVKNPLPRAYVVYAAAEVQGGKFGTMVTSIGAVLNPEITAGLRAVLTPTEGPRLAALHGTPGRGACKIERHETMRIDARCTASQPGLVVFVEQWSAGWQATVDGHAAPLGVVNIIMRGVPVEPGRHLISLRYSPPGLVVGALITGLALLFVVLCAFMTRPRPA